ncbi:hypothetical protein [Natrinema amylolyticum]|uniref:hypothetical protein n=1 Tax=Natrinema amylolyticum TaxID=2878679 RepID=UPI001CFAC367|nr:hypothetical protein [Natrinema amylolyticum]
MTADERPTPPPELDGVDGEVLAELLERDAATLRTVSAYIDDVAAWKEARGESESESAADPDAYPEGVPERATVSVTEIGDTEYHYYQWREGDEIRSRTVQR